jgi:type VI secretion system protein ImpE
MNGDGRLQPDQLEDTLNRLQERIRSEPAVAKHRVYLFQLLAVLGRWERALNQLNVLSDLDPATIPMVGTYRQAIQCEALRADVFAGKRSPVVLGEPEEWTALLIESLRLLGDDHVAQAEELRARAFEAAPTTAGSANGEAFAWIADADSRLGPVLEVIVNGRYGWVPFHRIGKIELEEPSDLRDLVWMPGQFTWANGGTMVGFIPTRYPGTESSGDGLHLLARRTDWSARGPETYLGTGQRMLATDVADYALLDIRSLELAPSADADAGDADRA